MGFISILLLFVIVGLAFLGVGFLIFSIVLFVVRINTKGKSKKLGCFSLIPMITLFLLGFLCLSPILRIIVLDFIEEMTLKMEYDNLKNPVVLERLDGGNSLMYNGKKLIQHNNLYIGNESVEKEELCNVVNTLTPKEMSDYRYLTLYRLINDTGYDIYWFNGYVMVAENDLDNILKYYENDTKTIAKIYSNKNNNNSECDLDYQRLSKIKEYYNEDKRRKDFKWKEYTKYEIVAQSADKIYKNETEVYEIEGHLYLSWSFDYKIITVYEMDADDEKYIIDMISNTKWE